MDQKSVLLVDSKQQAATFNADAYCMILEQLRAAIKQKCPGLLTKGVLLLHDNAWPHNANATRQLLQYFWWEILEHLLYSPDLAPSSYHLFPALKDHFGGHKFKKDDVAKIAVRWWL
jgi:histone-lysine N-methyltransferase SETMAR